MTPRAVDVVDVTPPELTPPEDRPPDVPRPDVPGAGPDLPPAVGAAAGVAGSIGRAIAWLVAAALALAAAWRPVTSELHTIPPNYGVPIGFIRRSTNGWGHVATTHSFFEGVDPGPSGQPVAVVLCLAAAAMICAALLNVAEALPGSTRRPRRLPAGAWVGGSGALVLAGTVAGVRAERLPHRPLDLPYSIGSQYGWGLWLAAGAVAVATLAYWLDRATHRAAMVGRPDPAPGRHRTTGDGRHCAIVAGGITAAAGLAVAAAMARAYSVSTTTSPAGVRTAVVYRFAARGVVSATHRPPVYSDLAATFDDVRGVDYVLPIGAAVVMLLVGLVSVGIGRRRGRVAATPLLAVPGLFLTGLLAAQVVDDQAVGAQVRRSDVHLAFAVGWAPWLTGAAAATSLAMWALAVRPEWVSAWEWPRRRGRDERVDATPAGADLLL